MKMSLNKCPICKEYIFWGNHKCDPEFYVFDENLEDMEYLIQEDVEPNTYYASCEEDAAIKCAKDNDEPREGEWNFLVISKKLFYEIWDNMTNDVDFSTHQICEAISSSCEQYTVYAEIILSYYACRTEE
jgi:hypothetical protein